MSPELAAKKWLPEETKKDGATLVLRYAVHALTDAGLISIEVSNDMLENKALELY